MTKIKFGTDGWRAIIAKEYTLDNVIRVAQATALFIKNNSGKSAVVGHDCRFGGPPEVVLGVVQKALLLK